MPSFNHLVYTRRYINTFNRYLQYSITNIKALFYQIIAVWTINNSQLISIGQLAYQCIHIWQVIIKSVHINSLGWLWQDSLWNWSRIWNRCLYSSWTEDFLLPQAAWWTQGSGKWICRVALLSCDNIMTSRNGWIN